LKNLGLEIKYSKAKGTYSVFWPTNIVSLKFTPYEFFFIYYCLKNIAIIDTKLEEIALKLELKLSGDTEPVYDCGPEYGISNNITEELSVLLRQLSITIVKNLKIVFFYRNLNGEANIRIVHPYKLIHTPISWYLVGYCEERKAFRNFKLARISQLKTLSDHFRKKHFSLKEHLGDAFWLQHNPTKSDNPHKIEILFTGEAAESIKEYKFHTSQTFEVTPDGTLVRWQLSYLGEFASWLLQWLGSFKIIEDNELKKIIEYKVTKGQQLLQ
jgi:predicted DNA-binding transcriptional regulator YafY